MNNLIIYLVRHGMTLCNEKKLYCGKSDIDLSENGKSELLNLKNTVGYPKFVDRYYTSGAKRSNQTFEILYPSENYECIKEFSEYDFGDFEIKSYDELKQNSLYINWLMDDIGNFSEFNGETKNQYKDRIKNAFINFVNNCFLQGLKSVLLVCHGGTIVNILQQFYIDNNKNFYQFQPKCGKGYKIFVSNKEGIKIYDKVEL